MKQSLEYLLTCGCLGISLLMAMPAVAETNIESDKNIVTVRSIKAIETHLKSLDSENTMILAEEDSASAVTVEAVFEPPSTRRPLPCRIFPTTSMQQ
ncbi:MAG: hypothetical protein WBA13_05905 [Microcoleaceae cyanobacterium]